MTTSIWMQLSLTYFLLAHIVLYIIVRHPQAILPKFMRGCLIINNFILRTKGIYVTKEQNKQFWENFQNNQQRIVGATNQENSEFTSYSVKQKIQIVKERIILYLKIMAYVWWVYLLVIAAGKILTRMDRTLEDQL